MKWTPCPLWWPSLRVYKHSIAARVCTLGFITQVIWIGVMVGYAIYSGLPDPSIYIHFTEWTQLLQIVLYSFIAVADAIQFADYVCVFILIPSLVVITVAVAVLITVLLLWNSLLWDQALAQYGSNGMVNFGNAFLHYLPVIVAFVYYGRWIHRGSVEMFMTYTRESIRRARHTVFWVYFGISMLVIVVAPIIWACIYMLVFNPNYVYETTFPIGGFIGIYIACEAVIIAFHLTFVFSIMEEIRTFREIPITDYMLMNYGDRVNQANARAENTTACCFGCCGGDEELEVAMQEITTASSSPPPSPTQSAITTTSIIMDGPTGNDENCNDSTELSSESGTSSVAGVIRLAPYIPVNQYSDRVPLLSLRRARGYVASEHADEYDLSHPPPDSVTARFSQYFVPRE